MPSKAKKPEVIRPLKPKILIYGPAKIGKTTLLLEALRLQLIDSEGGATQAKFRKKMLENGALYMGKDEGAGDISTLIQELRYLATEKHDRLTLGVDSYSKIWGDMITEAQAKVGTEYGRDKKGAISASRQFFYWLEKLDMTTFLVCHERENWIREGQNLVSAGKTFDGWDKLAFMLELILEVQWDKKFPSGRKAIVRGSRLEGFNAGDEFDLTWAEFSKRAGSEILTREATRFVVATEAQVSELKALLDRVKVPEGWEDKALAKEGVTDWAEMHTDRIQAAIEALKKAASVEVKV